jgi:hypothetical protein
MSEALQSDPVTVTEALLTGMIARELRKLDGELKRDLGPAIKTLGGWKPEEIIRVYFQQFRRAVEVLEEEALERARKEGARRP